MTLIPAYGRDYKNAKAVKEDWEANKDFIIADLFSGNDGRYANKADLHSENNVIIRYNRFAKICRVK